MRRRSLLSVLVAAFAASGASAPIVAWAREAVGEVLGRTIYRDELESPQRTLATFILPPIIERFVAAHRLVASDAEVDDFLTTVGMPPASTNAQRAEDRRMGSDVVLEWKLSKALYERYGGPVIFQQSNPLEPVGAMRQLLEDEEASGTFKIFDAAERERFYAYYTRQHPFVLPPARVSYDQPWWRMNPR